MKTILIVILLALIPFPVSANNVLKGNYTLKADIGRGTMVINEAFMIEGEKKTFNTTVFSVGGGYQFDWGLGVETGYTIHTNDNLFGADDGYSFSGIKVMTGFEIPVTNQLSVTPKIGWIEWDLTTKEGAFLHPGEEVETKYSGNDYILAGTLNYDVSGYAQFSLDYMETDCRVGDIKAVTLALILSL